MWEGKPANMGAPKSPTVGRVPEAQLRRLRLAAKINVAGTKWQGEGCAPDSDKRETVTHAQRTLATVGPARFWQQQSNAMLA